MSLWKKIQRRGILNSVEIAFNRIVPVWLFRFSVGDVLEMDLNGLCELQDQSDDRDLEFIRVDDDATRLILRAVTWNTVPIETTKLDLGYAIIRNLNEDTIIGGVWAGVDDFVEPNLGFRIELRDDQAWLYCAYLAEAARGKGTYQRLITFVANDLHDRGFGHLYVIIQPWNHASMHVHRKYSLRTVGRVIVLRIGSVALVRHTGSLRGDKSFVRQIQSDPKVIRLPVAI